MKWPRKAGDVSVVIPARNEEGNIERVVRSVARQDQVSEIIVVDDGSTDRTGEILKNLEREIPTLRTLRVECLPFGWTGKTHSAAIGARAAAGAWLLFTDADTVHMAGSLEQLRCRMEAEGADLLSVSPGQETPTWWEKAVIPRVYVQLAHWYPFQEISRPGSPSAAANGQYMLIRQTAYERAGGFESVRREVLEDVAFAERVKAQGGKIVFLPGSEWVRTRMYHSFGTMWEGWTKNLYPLAGRSAVQLTRAVTSCLIDVMPIAGCAASLASILVQSPDRPALLLFIAILCFLAALMRQHRYGREIALLGYDQTLATYQAIGSTLLALLLLNSWRAHRMSRRIEWKGRRYPTT